ncbi:1,4-alpha-glucan branching enzyme [Thermoflavifilum aggregans]|uniref:1,4-alpha-glucan branching enzyme GlgB n=1 Tax=Thermoflavifilum aggregans TaxID=454188 RepID=A0A2M9CVQ2_9BACT|nr:1,4-alpha-glucan branching protein GlgB [Thermoflavifilum aggregans]MBX6379477.1 1,4-alpha-glucan branching protein GlgB [Thermoflavifilum aggregans]PJJ75965.1 1,4-alpha-glucan branching enzyme [Thermoflavifilum aggregans]
MASIPTSAARPAQVLPVSLLTDFDISLFQAGKHYRLYQKLGCHLDTYENQEGAYFAVWAPYAEQVSVIGTCNNWQAGVHPLFPRWDQSGIWEGFIPRVKAGDLYKYQIRSRDGEVLYKGDPYAFHWETRPKTASIAWPLDYAWHDQEWMQHRKQYNDLKSPFSVYEVHLGSWRRPDPNNHEVFYSYRQIADQLVPYVKEMGFTHVELMPVMEHPFDGSWGYQITGYFAPTSRYGTPQDFMYMIDQFHQAGIGVILDWVPSHFPGDAHGLFRFDGSHVYEYADMRKGFQKDWNSYIFNYARNEVRSFLLSNAVYWLDLYHADGLRVDAVASMIYLDYSRKQGEWIPNDRGGRENLEAISLLQELNTIVYEQYPDTQTIAEESTAFYGVSKPVYLGGLGFGMKWMMGWMNDTLEYFKTDPYFRQFHHDQLTFSLVYAFSENFMLPLSHDEVVHGKSPMIYKMPGDDWQKFANLRLLYAYMFTHPGSKLLFMGNEFAQTSEWNFKRELDWYLLQYQPHQGMQQLIKQLNALYRNQTALHETQFMPIGFEWIDIGDRQHSIFIYSRHEINGYRKLLIALNMTPVPRMNYEIGMPENSSWREILNTDHPDFGGSGVLNPGTYQTQQQLCKGKPYQLTIHLPPLGAVIMERIA